jgi:hypothetical protein
LAVKGPDPETDRVERWRCVDLRDEVKRRFFVTVHENTIGVWLHEMKLTRLQPRPFHPRKDPAAQATFRKDFRGPIAEAMPQAAAGKPIEGWFQDEARVGQKGGHTYVWAPIGSRRKSACPSRG